MKLKVDGKYHLILNDNEEKHIFYFFDESMDKIAAIMSNPYSTRLKMGWVTYDSLRNGLRIYELWVKVQRDLVLFDRLCKSIDMKKLSEPTLLEGTEKIYKSTTKLIMTRNIENGFNLKKFMGNGSGLLL